MAYANGHEHTPEKWPSVCNVHVGVCVYMYACTSCTLYITCTWYTSGTCICTMVSRAYHFRTVVLQFICELCATYTAFTRPFWHGSARFGTV